MTKQIKKVPCRLVGMNGNAYAIMGRVRAALKKHGRDNLLEEYTARATSDDYNHLLAVSLEYVYEEEENYD